MDLYKATSQMDTDEVVRFEELRAWLVLFAEAPYQATGKRRVKNPRIWAMHDITALAQARG
jgi:3-methylcrotonyl-CoA carboxylase beta subunit